MAIDGPIDGYQWAFVQDGHIDGPSMEKITKIRLNRRCLKFGRIL